VGAPTPTLPGLGTCTAFKDSVQRMLHDEILDGISYPHCIATERVRLFFITLGKVTADPFKGECVTSTGAVRAGTTRFLL
jgi:hypothetical protein